MSHRNSVYGSSQTARTETSSPACAGLNRFSWQLHPEEKTLVKKMARDSYKVRKANKINRSDHMLCSIKIRSILSTVALYFLYGCSSASINGLNDSQPISPVVVFVESCKYDFGTLPRYVWDTAARRPSDRQRMLSRLVLDCRSMTESLKSSLDEQSISSKIVIVDSEHAPESVDRDKTSNDVGAKYQIFIHKPVIEAEEIPFGPGYSGAIVYRPYMTARIDVFRVGISKRVGDGEVKGNDSGKEIAVRIAKTLRQRCSSRWLNACGKTGSVQFSGS